MGEDVNGQNHGLRRIDWLGLVALMLTGVGLCIVYATLWFGRFEDKCEFRGQLIQEKVVHLRRKIEKLEERIPLPLPSSSKWREYYGQSEIQFHLRDELGTAIFGAYVLNIGTGEQVVTGEGGLSRGLPTVVGDEVLIEREGFESTKVVINRDNARKKMISVRLRRTSDVEDKSKK